MPNQRAIAAELGLTQATVSLALRHDPSISVATRQKVLETAERLGYRPNAYVASLMARIRTGRPVPDKGCIGVVYDHPSPEDWIREETYKAQYDGIVQKSSELGFHVESFCLRSKHSPPERLEKILYTRGITGLILQSIGEVNGQDLSLNWNRYSCAAIAYAWKLPWLDRVSSHHRHNVELAFRKLRERGYQRIGMCLHSAAWKGVDASWRAGFYLAGDEVPAGQRLQPFIGYPGETPLPAFKKWLKENRPDAIISLLGHEMFYLNQLKMKVPEDMGLACVNRPISSEFSGVEENHAQVGAAVAELVISGILRNDYGAHPHNKLVLIDGSWVDGQTLCEQKSAS